MAVLWNVGCRFKGHKSEVDAIRRDMGLPPSAINKLEFANRYDMAEFLDDFFQWLKPGAQIPADKRDTPAATIATAVKDDLPAWEYDVTIPEFLKNDWRKRRKQSST